MGLPAPRMPGASPSCCLPHLNPVREPTELHLKPVGRSGLLERLLLSLPALVVRDRLLTSRVNLPEGSSQPLILVSALLLYQVLLQVLLFIPLYIYMHMVHEVL